MQILMMECVGWFYVACSTKSAIACDCKHESETSGTKMWRISVLADLILGSQGRFLWNLMSYIQIK